MSNRTHPPHRPGGPDDPLERAIDEWEAMSFGGSRAAFGNVSCLPRPDFVAPEPEPEQSREPEQGPLDIALAVYGDHLAHLWRGAMADDSLSAYEQFNQGYEVLYRMILAASFPYATSDHRLDREARLLARRVVVNALEARLGDALPPTWVDALP
jgi:hypothetical protein